MVARVRKKTTVEEWAAAYWPFGDDGVVTSEDITQQLLKGNILPDRSKARSGLPERFPQPIVRDHFWINQPECSRAAQKAFKSGYGEALLEYCMWHFRYARLNRSDVALTDQLRDCARMLERDASNASLVVGIAEAVRRLAHKFDRKRDKLRDEDDLPMWAQNALSEAFELWRDHRIETLDSKLYLTRSGRKLSRLQRERDFAEDICAAVKDADARGVPVQDHLFERIGQHFHMGKTAAKEIYYQELKKVPEK